MRSVQVTWYTERAVSQLSLGGLLILVVIRTIQYNMLKMRDKYLHTNCLAALANMSSQFKVGIADMIALSRVKQDNISLPAVDAWISKMGKRGLSLKE